MRGGEKERTDLWRSCFSALERLLFVCVCVRECERVRAYVCECVCVFVRM